MTKFLAALIVLFATAALADPTPRPVIGHCILENGNRKACVEWQPKVTPTPAPTATPKPTSSLDCESPSGIKAYGVGEEKLLCFDAGPKRSFVEVSVVNLHNSSCSQMMAHLSAPSGATFDSLGSQPNTILPWEAGKFYLWTKLIWGCNTYTFTPR